MSCLSEATAACATIPAMDFDEERKTEGVEQDACLRWRSMRMRTVRPGISRTLAAANAAAAGV